MRTLWGLGKIPDAVSLPKTSNHGTLWQILVSSLQNLSGLSLEASTPPKQSWAVTSERILVCPGDNLPWKLNSLLDFRNSLTFQAFLVSVGMMAPLSCWNRSHVYWYITGTSGSPGSCLFHSYYLAHIFSCCSISCKENANTLLARSLLHFISSSTQCTLCFSRVADDTVSKLLLLHDKQLSSSGVMESLQKHPATPAIYILR